MLDLLEDFWGSYLISKDGCFPPLIRNLCLFVRSFFFHSFADFRDTNNNSNNNFGQGIQILGFLDRGDNCDRMEQN
jgi:hypothetical protein